MLTDTREAPAGCARARRTPRPRAVRRVILPLALACVYFLAGRWPAAAQQPAAGARPNVLLILVDDLGYRDVGFQGATEIDTPNFDRLAQAGVIFSNGYVAHPVCAPSRAALMTGRYPARFGMELNLSYAPYDEHHGLPLTERTVADYLREAGYRTGMVGKWHLGAAPVFHPLNRGFDYFYGFTGGGHDYFRIDLARAPLQEYLLPLNDGRGAAGFEGYLTDALTDRALDFIAADRDTPFFLYLSYNAPHTPLQAPEATVRKYLHVADGNRRRYLAMIDSLDYNVGRVMAALQQAGRWENTLTFFLSDNGGSAGAGQDWADNGPLRGGKGSLFDGGIRVPFTASWPARWPGGAPFEPMIISLDIAATVLAAAGAAAAAELPLDGVNLDPFMRGTAGGVPHEALFWATDRITEQIAGYAVRTGATKLVKDRLGEGPALFDLQADPGETRDRLAEEPATVARLAALWNDWNQRNSTDFFFWTELHEQERREMQCRLVRHLRYAGSGRAPLQLTGESLTPELAAAEPPAPPAGLTAAAGDRSIELAWDDPGDPTITFYQLRVLTSQESDWSRWSGAGVCSYAETSHTLYGLTNGLRYRIQLRVHNTAGASEPIEVSATPWDPDAVDAAPSPPPVSAPEDTAAPRPPASGPWLAGAAAAALAAGTVAAVRYRAARARNTR